MSINVSNILTKIHKNINYNYLYDIKGLTEEELYWLKKAIKRQKKAPPFQSVKIMDGHCVEDCFRCPRCNCIVNNPKKDNYCVQCGKAFLKEE